MRLIDADALHMRRADPESCIRSEYVCGWNTAVAAIEAAPTIDAVPVDKIHFTDLYLDGSEAIAVFKFGNQGITLRKKCEEFAPVVHGRWIPKQDGFWKKQILICSICGSRNALDYEFNHCPNCGAKMDEEVEE